jgi:hypothetical protein
MSKGRIISHSGEGLYSVELIRRYGRINARLAVLETVIAETQTMISDLEVEISGASEDEKPALIQRENYLSLKLLNLQNERTDLLAYVNAQPEVIQAWCADYTLDLSGDVGISDVPGTSEQDFQGVTYYSPTIVRQIRPGYSGKAVYNSARDGILQHAKASSPANHFLQACFHSAVMKWKPQYRHGKITSIMYDIDRCAVSLDSAYDRYLIENYNVNQVTELSGIPIEYMNCNSKPFVNGDDVIIEWQNGVPKVIGFKDNPKPCINEALFSIIVNSALYALNITDDGIEIISDFGVHPDNAPGRAMAARWNGNEPYAFSFYDCNKNIWRQHGRQPMDLGNFNNYYSWCSIDAPENPFGESTRAGMGGLHHWIDTNIYIHCRSGDVISGMPAVFDGEYLAIYDLTPYSRGDGPPHDWDYPQIYYRKEYFWDEITEKYIKFVQTEYSRTPASMPNSFSSTLHKWRGFCRDYYPAYYPDSSISIPPFSVTQGKITTDLAPSAVRVVTGEEVINDKLSYFYVTETINQRVKNVKEYPASYGQKLYWKCNLAAPYSVCLKANFYIPHPAPDIENTTIHPTMHFLHPDMPSAFFNAGIWPFWDGYEEVDYCSTDKRAYHDANVITMDYFESSLCPDHIYPMAALVGETYEHNGFFELTDDAGTQLFSVPAKIITYARGDNAYTGMMMNQFWYSTPENPGWKAYAAWSSTKQELENNQINQHKLIFARSEGVEILTLDGADVKSEILTKISEIAGRTVLFSEITGISARGPEFIAGDAFAEAINAVRADVGSAPISPNGLLAVAAERHANDMAENNFFSHTGSDGSTAFDRISDAGYFIGPNEYGSGENCTMSTIKTDGVAEVIESWINSPPHYANMINSDFTEFGIFLAVASDGTKYWCCDFGFNR